VDPRSFLQIALILKGGPGSPESYRSAISRAYYAAFNVGVETLRAIGIHLSEGPAGHGELRHCLGACGDPDLDDASGLLGTLHGRRRRADYRMDDVDSESRNEADLAYLESRQIIEALDLLRGDPSKDAARTEMRRYARDVRRLPVT
jgi:hypothetical protein